MSLHVNVFVGLDFKLDFKMIKIVIEVQNKIIEYLLKINVIYITSKNSIFFLYIYLQPHRENVFLYFLNYPKLYIIRITTLKKNSKYTCNNF